MTKSLVDKYKEEHPIRWFIAGLKINLDYAWYWVIDGKMCDGRTFRTRKIYDKKMYRDWLKQELEFIGE